jgi:hypothetical protein
MARRSIKRHVRRAISVGRAAAQGIKGTAFATAGGAAVGMLDSYLIRNMVDTAGVTTTFGQWAGPAVAVIGGHFLKRSMPDLGNGVIGGGGYALGYRIYNLYLAKSSAPAATKGLVEPRAAFQAGMMAGASQAANAQLSAGRVGPSAGAPTAGAPSAFRANSARSL